MGFNWPAISAFISAVRGALSLGSPTRGELGAQIENLRREIGAGARMPPATGFESYDHLLVAMMREAVKAYEAPAENIGGAEALGRAGRLVRPGQSLFEFIDALCAGKGDGALRYYSDQFKWAVRDDRPHPSKPEPHRRIHRIFLGGPNPADFDSEELVAIGWHYGQTNVEIRHLSREAELLKDFRIPAGNYGCAIFGSQAAILHEALQAVGKSAGFFVTDPPTLASLSHQYQKLWDAANPFDTSLVRAIRAAAYGKKREKGKKERREVPRQNLAGQTVDLVFDGEVRPARLLDKDPRGARVQLVQERTIFTKEQEVTLDIDTETKRASVKWCIGNIAGLEFAK